MKCDFYACKNNDNITLDKSKCTKVQTPYDSQSVIYVCENCIKDYKDRDGYIFTCTNCKDLYIVDDCVFPCSLNDGSCPTLCEKCYLKTGLIVDCDCGIYCKTHLSECICDK